MSDDKVKDVTLRHIKLARDLRDAFLQAQNAIDEACAEFNVAVQEYNDAIETINAELNDDIEFPGLCGEDEQEITLDTLQGIAENEHLLKHGW